MQPLSSQGLKLISSGVASGQKRLEKLWEEEEKRRRDQEWSNELIKREQELERGGKENPDGTVTPKKVSFIEFLNPVGEYGLFGSRNTTEVSELGAQIGAVSRATTDRIIGEEGDGEFNSANDVSRFLLNLPAGVAEGFLESGRNFREAATGERLGRDETGEIVVTDELSTAQRLGAGAVGVLDTFGLAAGGTGKFFREIIRTPLDRTLRSTVTNTTAQTAIRETGRTAARAGVEGVEEVISSVAQDVQDDGRLEEDWAKNAAQSFALGVAAGGVFDVGGRAIGTVRDASKSRAVTKQTGIVPEVRQATAAKLSESDGLSEAQKATYANALTEIGQTVSAIDDPTLRQQEFDARAAEALETARVTPVTEQIPSRPGAQRVSPEEARELVRVDMEMNTRLGEIKQQLDVIGDAEGLSDARVVDSPDITIDDANSQIDSQVRAIETQIRDLEQQAEGLNNVTEQVLPPENVDPSAYVGDVESRTAAAERVKVLKEQIQELESAREVQTNALMARSLKAERAKIINWKITNNNGETAESLQQKIDDIDNGIVSEEFVSIRDDAKTVPDAIGRAKEFDPTDTTGIQRAAAINEIHREAVRQKIAGLWTPEKAQQFEMELDSNYNARKEQIKEFPGPKQEEETALLDQEYIEDRANNQARLDEDADEYNAAVQSNQILDDIEANILDRYNNLQASSPEAFGAVDAEVLAEAKTGLEIARTLRKEESNPESVSPIETEDTVKQSIKDADDTAEASEIIESNATLTEEAGVLMADLVSDGSLRGEWADYGLRSVRTSLNRLENGERISTRLDEALHSSVKSDARMEQRAKNDVWKASWHTPEATSQSIAFWDRGQEMTQLEGETQAQFTRRTKAATSVKEWLGKKAEELGLSPEQMLENYFPHNFQQTFGKSIDSVGESIARLNSNVDENGKTLTDAQRVNLAKKIEGVDFATRQRIEQANIYRVGKNGHLEKRQGAEGWSTDIPFVLDSYQRMANKTAYMQPALDEIRGLTANVGEKQRKFIEDALNTVTGNQARLDDILGKRITGTLSGARRLSNVALMGASVRTMALQPFATINNWRESPSTRQYLASTVRAMAAMGPSNAVRTSPLLREFYEEGGMNASFSASLRKGKLTKVENILLGGVSLIDTNMRLAAYDIGKHEYASKVGKSIEALTPDELSAAKRAGVVKANKAQFDTSPLGIPLAQSSEVGKAVFQLQQFNIKQFDYERRHLIGSEGNPLLKLNKNDAGKVIGVGFTRKGAETLVKTMVGYTSMYLLYTQLQIGDDEDSRNPFGFSPEDMLPFGEQLGAVWSFFATGELKEVQAPIPPLFSAAFGRGGNDRGILGHLGSAIVGGDDIDRADEIASAALSAFRNFAPAGTQITRAAQGAQALSQGESIGASGSTRFLIDNESGWNVVKGLVSGQYATSEGQEWLRTGMNTISKDNTVELPDGSKIPVSEYVRSSIRDPEVKAQYIGYYSAKQNANAELSKNDMSRDSFLKNLRTRMTAGQVSMAQARTEAQRYNDTVIALYGDYVRGNNNIPARLSYDLSTNVLLNPSDVTPLSQRRPNEENRARLDEWYRQETY